MDIVERNVQILVSVIRQSSCLLYTSDAADE